MFRSAIVFAAFSASLLGCDTSESVPPRPDVTGAWDLAYDDFLEVQVDLGGVVQRARIPRRGGEVVLHDAGLSMSVRVDCEADAILCPEELWKRELYLMSRMGDVDDDGENLFVSLRGEGKGACRLQEGSALRAELATEGQKGTAFYRGTTLTRGVITTELDGACLNELSLAPGLPGNARIRISTGFSGVRRS